MVAEHPHYELCVLTYTCNWAEFFLETNRLLKKKRHIKTVAACYQWEAVLLVTQCWTWMFPESLLILEEDMFTDILWCILTTFHQIANYTINTDLFKVFEYSWEAAYFMLPSFLFVLPSETFSKVQLKCKYFASVNTSYPLMFRLNFYRILNR